jgi:predicted MPP superfamily phosphohydrolase
VARYDGGAVVHETTVELAGMPPGAAPLRVVLASDFHVIGPQMPPSRLAGIVAQINALHPDYVLLAGDYAAWQMPATKIWPLRDAVAPLGRLRARFGTFAVLGNHDHGENAMPGDPPTAPTLEQLGITVLENRAVRAGPLTLIGTDSQAPGFRRAVWRGGLRGEIARLGPPYLGFAHFPSSAVAQPDPIRLVMAGHTHCGQIALPWIGAPLMGAMPRRLSCGRVDENGRTLIVTGGLGESNLPFRFLVPPDIWLVTLVAPRHGPPPPRHVRQSDPIYGVERHRR